ncbi:phospho-N-acetylmuramoyl-pentapeptide-transferase [Kocuria palustris]|uniref:phospho-N-acetylmuramoyl-pentapeptide- transferase n=1 Tax=Kocuria palustris TaxID=71999 RepID=UPI000DB1808D|nr:phospho-N-acetylmuramoyl-pentapeptide-transferase [Kocuria palustris]MBM7822062.1 phospho-N-acetylmuramoyl-pentapeptide-transferase [Kocuria palustris]MDN5572654.1 phospho-N-acetylmuramoyl-pentapeptide-transferase [Micrococcales bacterium]PZO70479.1 MAG: phospho-N-acetylmuramoyl-pentapeptide-transferase [Kocuria palustris]
MIQIIVAAALGLLLSILGTPLFIRFLASRGYGQFIREDGPSSHQTKRGTPTMGGVAILGSAVIAYLASHTVVGLVTGEWTGPTASGLLAAFLMLGMGFVGGIDDAKKITKKQNLGLSPGGKIALQGTIGTVFALLTVMLPDARGRTPGSTEVSLTRDTGLDLGLGQLGGGLVEALTSERTIVLVILGLILYVVWVNLIATATTNAVNLTDGLDGLATGASILVFSGYLLITLWQSDHLCGEGGPGLCYTVRDPSDLTVLAAALVGALIGFLWWNTSPAKIFMGDTGSLGLGGALAAFAILTRTELLLVLIAGLFVLITVSVILQVGWFKLSGGKRIFKMAPLQHHFELKGWQEVTIVVRFWIIAGLFTAVALAVFYGEWLISNGGAFL